MKKTPASRYSKSKDGTRSSRETWHGGAPKTVAKDACRAKAALHVFGTRLPLQHTWQDPQSESP
jgi:hypothetical protein